MSKKIKLYYFKDMPNFGDALNVNLCKELFDIEVKYETPEKCKASFIGSLLDDFLYSDKKIFPKMVFKKYLQPTVKIWGSGFMFPENGFVKRPNNLPELYFRKVEIYAIRGLLSKTRLEKILSKKLNNIIVADPGLLASSLIDVKQYQKKYDLGIIPNHLEKGLEIFKKVQANIPNSIIIDMEAEPKKVLKDIVQCKAILSSALHGLITADSFNIPNKWVIASDKVIGRDYKFKDYYSTYNISPEEFDLRNNDFNINDLENIYKHYKIKKEDVDILKEKLIDSFPFNKEEN